VILPGSKNVLGDLRFLRDCGLAAAIVDLARSGRCQIIGICGGFQMLGEWVEDPHRWESGGEPQEAWDCCRWSVTTLEAEKTGQ
jgi:adenosylcobyric acid synthase